MPIEIASAQEKVGDLSRQAYGRLRLLPLPITSSRGCPQRDNNPALTSSTGPGSAGVLVTLEAGEVKVRGQVSVPFGAVAGQPIRRHPGRRDAHRVV